MNLLFPSVNASSNNGEQHLKSSQRTSESSKPNEFNQILKKQTSPDKTDVRPRDTEQTDDKSVGGSEHDAGGYTNDWDSANNTDNGKSQDQITSDSSEKKTIQNDEPERSLSSVTANRNQPGELDGEHVLALNLFHFTASTSTVGIAGAETIHYSDTLSQGFPLARDHTEAPGFFMSAQSGADPTTSVFYTQGTFDNGSQRVGLSAIDLVTGSAIPMAGDIGLYQQSKVGAAFESSLVSVSAEVNTSPIKIGQAQQGADFIRFSESQQENSGNDNITLFPKSSSIIGAGVSSFENKFLMQNNMLTAFGRETDPSGQLTSTSFTSTNPFEQTSNPAVPGGNLISLTQTSDIKVHMPVTISFGQSGWANMVAERSAMMASQNIKFAELQLDPPELGPLQVKVAVNQDQATVSFVAANAQVKDALDQTLMRLKDLLGEQGLDLLNVDVSDQSSQQSKENNTDDETQLGLNNVDELEEQLDDTRSLHVSYGIDHYA